MRKLLGLAWLILAAPLAAQPMFDFGPGNVVVVGGGSGFTGTEGSVPFVGGDGNLTEDNASFQRPAGGEFLVQRTAEFGRTFHAVNDALGGDAVVGEVTHDGSGGQSYGVVGTASGANCFGVAGQAAGAGGTGTSGTGLGDGGVGVLGESQSGYAILARSLSPTNIEPTLVSRRFSTSVADLIQAQAADGSPLFAITATGGIFVTLPTSNPGPGLLWNDGGTVKVGS